MTVSNVVIESRAGTEGEFLQDKSASTTTVMGGLFRKEMTLIAPFGVELEPVGHSLRADVEVCYSDTRTCSSSTVRFQLTPSVDSVRSNRLRDLFYSV